MKKFLALLLALVMVFALAACGEAETEETTPAGEETTPAGEGTEELGYIGISMPTQSLERWNRDGSYLDQQFQAAGYKTMLTFANNETDQQVNDIQNMIADGVDLLVISAIDGRP